MDSHSPFSSQISPTLQYSIPSQPNNCTPHSAPHSPSESMSGSTASSPRASPLHFMRGSSSSKAVDSIISSQHNSPVTSPRQQSLIFSTTVKKAVSAMIHALKQKNAISGSFHAAVNTLKLLKLAVDSSKAHSPQQLISEIKCIGKKLENAASLEFAVGNMVRRIVHMIREEESSVMIEQSTNFSKLSDSSVKSLSSRASHLSGFSSLSSLFYLHHDNDEKPSNISMKQLKISVIDNVNILLDQIANIFLQIRKAAPRHICDGDVIFTMGNSLTIREFFRYAHTKKISFKVIVAETAPGNSGQVTARVLASLGIPTTLIPDASAFSAMVKADKIIVGVHAVMANGGILAVSGLRAIAEVANYYSIPFIVCCGLYKLTPQYPFNQDTFNEFGSPDSVMSFEEIQLLGEDITILNPLYDYIPPKLISLYVTNEGSSTPQSIYKLLGEHFNTQDYIL